MTENPYSSPVSGGIESRVVEGRARLVPVTIALLVVSILWIFLALFGIGHFLRLAAQNDSDPDFRQMCITFSVYLGFEIFYSCLLVTGAFSMIRRGSYAWAMVTSCLALVPILSPFYFLGIPIGIWALFVLRKPNVKAAFTKL